MARRGRLGRTFQATSDLINGCFSAYAPIENFVDVRGRDDLADCGVIGINYAVVNTVPVAIVAQLWCFRDLDPPGSWLDTSEYIIEDEGDGRERAGFTARAFMAGHSISDRPVLGDAIRDRGWVRVIRLPVAPHMGMEFPVWEHVEAGEYEVVGIPDEHDVPVRMASPWPRADILRWSQTDNDPG